MTAAPQSIQPKVEPVRQHSPLPWCIPAGAPNGFIICSGDNPEKPGPILMIVSKPNGRAYVLTDSDIADNTALMIEAVNSHASLKARIQGLEGALREIVERDQFCVFAQSKTGPTGVLKAEYVAGPFAKIASAALEAKPAGGTGA